MASGWYNKGKFEVLSEGTQLDTDTIKVMLVDDTYVFDAAHNFVSDVVADEVSGSGYTGGFAGAGRKTLGSKAFSEDDANSRAEFDSSADMTWTSISVGTVGGAILIREVTNDADSVVLAFMDFDPDVVTNGGNMTIQWNAEGILQIG